MYDNKCIIVTVRSLGIVSYKNWPFFNFNTTSKIFMADFWGHRHAKRFIRYKLYQIFYYNDLLNQVILAAKSSIIYLLSIIYHQDDTDEAKNILG